MIENIVVPIAFFISVIVVLIAVPIVRSVVRRWDRQEAPTGLTPELAMRLDRIEAIVESVAVEVERLSEGQRFTTRLLSEGGAQPASLNRNAAAPRAVEINEKVNHA